MAACLCWKYYSLRLFMIYIYIATYVTFYICDHLTFFLSAYIMHILKINTTKHLSFLVSNVTDLSKYADTRSCPNILRNFKAWLFNALRQSKIQPPTVISNRLTSLIWKALCVCVCVWVAFFSMRLRERDSLRLSFIKLLVCPLSFLLIALYSHCCLSHNFCWLLQRFSHSSHL